MESAEIIIRGEGIRDIAGVLRRKENIYYKYESDHIVILMEEEYYFRIESNLMSVYILDFKQEGQVKIQIHVGGGAHSGLFDHGAEGSESKKMARSIIEICQERGWELVEVTPQEFKDSLEKTAAEKLMDSVLGWFKK